MDVFDYSKIIEESLQFAVKKILVTAEKNGLFGGHHFFISFKTTYPGVQLSDRIRSRYPQEITIVIQHQYEELKVDEHFFSVVLSFNNIKEKVVVPFNALTAFADPSVKFGLQFKAYHEAELEDNYTGEIVDQLSKVDKKPNLHAVETKEESKEPKSNVIDFKSFKNKKKK